jgi:hypothetical protein
MASGGMRRCFRPHSNAFRKGILVLARRSVFKLLAGTVVAVTALAPIAADARCLTTTQTTAAQVRLLQTELMVAALSCRSVADRNFIPQYNQFMSVHSDRLITHGKVLQAYFNEVYGKNGQTRLDKFITTIANDSSTRSMQSTSYCDDSVSLFQEVVAVKRGELEEYSKARMGTPDALGEVCAPGKASATVTARK